MVKYYKLNFDKSKFFGKKYSMNVKVSMLDDIKKLNEKGLITNACLIYSMWNGYIERDDKLKRFIDEIKSMNIDFIKLHTSGHCDIKSMIKLNEIVKPNKTIIIHTESMENGINIFDNVIKLNDNESINI